MPRFLHNCWCCLKWSLAAVLLTVLTVVVVAYLWIDDEICRRIEQRCRAHYPGHRVTLGGARLVSGEGLELSDLVIGGEDGVDGIAVGEIRVECDTNVGRLAQGLPKPRRITIRRPVLRVVRQPDGRLNVASLWPPPRFGQAECEIVIEDGTVEFTDRLVTDAGGPANLLLQDVSLRLTPLSSPEMPVGAEFGGQARLLRFTGSARSDHVKQVTLEGVFDPMGAKVELSGRATGIELSPQLCAVIPSVTMKAMGFLPGSTVVGGRLDADYRLAWDAARQPALSYSVSAQLAHGRIDDPRLPHSLGDVTAVIQAGHEGLAVERLTASNGRTLLSMSLHRRGWNAEAPLVISLDARQVLLSAELFTRLKPWLAEVEADWRPRGEVDLTAHGTRQGNGWQWDTVLAFSDASFVYRRFPYRLEHCRGRLELKDGGGRFAIFCPKDNVPVQIDGEFKGRGGEATGWARVVAEQMVVDDALVQALPTKPRQFVCELRPSGKVRCQWQLQRPPGAERFSQQLDIEILDGSLCYERFAYPLSGVRGRIESRDGVWRFLELTGKNAGGNVTCQGTLEPAPSGNRLTLNFQGQRMALDEQLRMAVPADVRKAWDHLHPRGLMDFEATLQGVLGQGPLQLTAAVDPVPGTCSLQPDAFPYLIEQLEGRFTYGEHAVRWENCRGRHGQTEITTGGRFAWLADGGCVLDLPQVNVNRLSADHDLMVAVPPGLKNMIRQLNPVGVANVTGSMRMERPPQPSAPVASTWKLRIETQSAELQCGLRLQDIAGNMTLEGSSLANQYRARGELDINSLQYRGLKWTRIRGPIWIDDGRVLLGSWVAKEDGSQPRSVSAEFYGGAVSGDAWIVSGEPVQHAVQAVFRDVDLAGVAGETLPGRHKLKGRVDGQFAVQGRGTIASTLNGAGSARLRDADLYELPVVIALLKVLSVRLPDTTAFTESEAKFRVQGDQILFEHLDLLGDAVNLYGNGTMDWEKNLNLAFHTNFRQTDLPIPLLRGLIAEASQQILQVSVQGTFDQPQIRTEAFPVVNQTFQQIQSDLETAAERQSLLFPDPWKWLRSSTPQGARR